MLTIKCQISVELVAFGVKGITEFPMSCVTRARICTWILTAAVFAF